MHPVRKIKSELCIDRYTALQLEGGIPKESHTKYVIDGIVYDIVPVYDLPDHIAIIASGGFVGKTVEFV